MLLVIAPVLPSLPRVSEEKDGIDQVAFRMYVQVILPVMKSTTNQQYTSEKKRLVVGGRSEKNSKRENETVEVKKEKCHRGYTSKTKDM